MRTLLHLEIILFDFGHHKPKFLLKKSRLFSLLKIFFEGMSALNYKPKHEIQNATNY